MQKKKVKNIKKSEKWLNKQLKVIGYSDISKILLATVDVNEKSYNIINLIRKNRYTRMPVYYDKLDSIVGILNVKDIASEEIYLTNNGEAYYIDRNYIFIFLGVMYEKHLFTRCYRIYWHSNN